MEDKLHSPTTTTNSLSSSDQSNHTSSTTSSIMNSSLSSNTPQGGRTYETFGMVQPDTEIHKSTTSVTTSNGISSETTNQHHNQNNSIHVQPHTNTPSDPILFTTTTTVTTTTPTTISITAPPAVTVTPTPGSQSQRNRNTRIDGNGTSPRRPAGANTASPVNSPNTRNGSSGTTNRVGPYIMGKTLGVGSTGIFKNEDLFLK